jgi:tRNA pseudouridine55 synthase
MVGRGPGARRAAPAEPGPDGVLLVDKPRGPTSFEVVRRVRRALSAAKAGHTGTLDPMATGLLAVCLGEGVKLQQWLVEGDKAYQAEVAFGAATDTEDAEGEVVARGDPAGLSAEAVAAALPRLTGELDQVPPMYSAVRVGGRRLHEAARAGEEVERAPRRVRVDALVLEAFAPAAADGLARARLRVDCGKGTYVRTLAADLGRLLSVPSHLSALRRTRVGPFSLEGALPLEEAERLGREDAAALRARVVPLAEALGFLPAVRLDARQARDLRQGKALAVEPPAGPLLRALDEEGRLVALCAPAGAGLRPIRVLPAPPSR